MSGAASVGPWYVCRGLFSGDYGVIRTVYGSGRMTETMTDRRGRERRFATEAAAINAIARTGQARPAPVWEQS